LFTPEGQIKPKYPHAEIHFTSFFYPHKLGLLHLR
jgi:hypothetical protein